MPDLGIRFQLHIGQNSLSPAPYEVMIAFQSAEIRTDAQSRDGFQLTFSLGRNRQSREYHLLQENYFEPPNRISLIAVIQGRAHVLSNGIITRTQVMPTNEPGQATLQVTGEDIGLLLDLTEKSQVFRDMSDANIIRQILRDYSDFQPQVTNINDTQPFTSQQGTDRRFIESLARRNSFVFYTEPTETVGTSTAYWGPRLRREPAQSPLTMNMGAATNVTQLSFAFNALGPITTQAAVADPSARRMVDVAPPSLEPSVSFSRTAQPLRTRILRDTVGLSQAEATRRVTAVTTDASDAVTGNGEVDTVLYGGVLHARRKVSVRGAGRDYDGEYFVQQVTHRIKKGVYKQSFTLKREGRGAAANRVSS